MSKTKKSATPTPKASTKLEPHVLAELFPSMTVDELRALTTDICKYGLREPIVLYEGKILDGRSRYAACLAAGREPVTTTLKAGVAPRAYVYSVNAHRRHLSAVQIGVLASKYLKDSKEKLTLREVSERFGISYVTLSYVHRALESGDVDLKMLVNASGTNGRDIKALLEAKGLAEKRDEETKVLGADGVMRTKAEDDAHEASKVLGTGTTAPAPVPAAQARATAPISAATGTGAAAARAAARAPSTAHVTHVQAMQELASTLARSTEQDLEVFFKAAVQNTVWNRLQRIAAKHEASKVINKAKQPVKEKK
jgi:ParB family chromosome partitioning protein